MAEHTVHLDPRARNLTSETFGQLTAIRPTAERVKTSIVWECRCRCGRLVYVAARYLSRLNTRSCGCVRSRRAERPGRERSIWIDMRNRCNNPNNKRFYRYGARGIRVCERWNNFKSFLKDMGPCPARMSIERIDNDGDYTPENCRWATNREQARNMCSNRMIEFRGKTLCLVDWSIATGLSADVIYARLKMGWSVERSLTQPVRPLKRRRHAVTSR